MIGLDFKTEASHYKEDMTLKLSPTQLAKHLSLGKAQAVAGRHKNALIIAGDTFGVFNKKLLGKPRTKIAAQKMLKQLSGKAHFMVSGFAIIDSATGKTISKSVKTKVYIRKLSSKEIQSYVNSKEPLDKAGAYAIQGLGASIVEKIEGDYSNVVGLPISALVRELKKFGVYVLN